MNFLESICDCRAVTLVQPTSSCFGGLAVRGKTLEVKDLIIKELSPKQHAVHTLPKPTGCLLVLQGKCRVGGFVGFCKLRIGDTKKKHHKEKQREQSPIAAYSSSCPQAYWLYWEGRMDFWHFAEANFGAFKYLASKVCMRMLSSGPNGSARGWTHATEQGFQ